MYLIVTEARLLRKRLEGVEERLTEVQYSITNKTESFTACTPILRYSSICLQGHNIEYRRVGDRGGSPYQHMREIIPLFKLVANDTLQSLYGARFQQVRHFCWRFREHLPAYLRGSVVF